ncbi:tyrosine-type recombinase/integrase [Roseovarius sp.]|uniref:tyrosine-type recombinase/integrase n=1 Tax=Roseovarius sp. TaxID=1486281 RepID=UPI0032EAD31D
MRGGFCVYWHDETGTRRRYQLEARTRAEAEAEGRDRFLKETTANQGATVASLWEAYRDDRKGRTIAESMRHTGKAVLPAFGHFRPEQITTEDCRSQIEAWRAQGKHDGTIWTRMNHLRIVLNWAQKHHLIDRAPYIERPPQPAPRDRHLTETEIAALLAAPCEPHIKTAIILMLTTCARVTAALELTWDRVDFDRGFVNLRTGEGHRKGRAIVPINGLLRSTLETARAAALSDYVIEWGGKPVKSIKRGFARAVENAELKDVSPHVLRHTGAVHMAAAGVPMVKIAQMLGHTNTATTERTYARFAPDHLKDAAQALEFGTLKVVK